MGVTFGPNSSMPKLPNVLDTVIQREDFVAKDLVGKRVLHVKGFGSSFKDPTPEEDNQEAEQIRQAIDAMTNFKPDFLVVDGDPWGNGFQRCVKAYVDEVRENSGTVPSLIWAKELSMSTSNSGQPTNDAYRAKRIKKAGEWAKQDIDVTVFWIDEERINDKIDHLFGAGTWKNKLEPAKFCERGLVRILSGERPKWVAGVHAELLKTIEAVESPTREAQQFFEQCSFVNAAKGNVIFDALDNPRSAAHGAVIFGGGESVVLELATLYLNSAQNTSVSFDCNNAAVFPHSRGRDGDPKLPQIAGSAFENAMGGVNVEVLDRQLSRARSTNSELNEKEQRKKASMIKNTFVQAGANHDSRISRGELVKLMGVLGERDTQAGFTEAQLLSVFDAADLDKDGFICCDEFIDWLFSCTS